MAEEGSVGVELGHDKPRLMSELARIEMDAKRHGPVWVTYEVINALAQYIDDPDIDRALRGVAQLP